MCYLHPTTSSPHSSHSTSRLPPTLKTRPSATQVERVKPCVVEGVLHISTYPKSAKCFINRVKVAFLPSLPLSLCLWLFLPLCLIGRRCQSTASTLWMHKAAMVIGEGLIMCIDQDSAYSLTSGKKIKSFRILILNTQKTSGYLFTLKAPSLSDWQLFSLGLTAGSRNTQCNKAVIIWYFHKPLPESLRRLKVYFHCYISLYIVMY